MAHTPGPWALQNGNEICALNEHESLIAEVFDGAEQWRDNGRLLAAAPTLLDRCKMSLQDAKDALGGKWVPTAEGWQSIIDDLTSVIARAGKR